MKFLCEQCKAKYQIADEKVAGRTVRMKCRKCGHMIEVRAEVTESSVSRFPPAPDDPSSVPRPSSLATSFSAARPSRTSQVPSALAGAFQRKIRDDEDETVMAPLASFDASVTEEWYAAINGVPAGPMRLSELRTKASAGAINDDTLVWQEGFEEWRPVKTITQLSALVREAAAPKALTGLAPSPLSSPTPAPPRAAVKPAAAARVTAPLGAAPAAFAARSNVVPISRGSGGGAAAAVALAPASAPYTANPMTAVASAPVSAPASAPAANPFAGIDPFAPIAPLAQPTPAADPFAVPPLGASAPVADPFAFTPGPAAAFAPAPAAAPQLAPAAVGMAVTDSILPPPPQKKGPPLMFIAVLVLAGAFGITAAVLTFKDKPAVVPVAASTPSASVPGIAASPVPSAAETAVAVVEADAAAAPQKVAMGGPRGPGPAPVASASAKGTAVDLTVMGLSPSTGPRTPGLSGPSGPSGPSAGTGQPLDTASITKTINTYKVAVKRRCWDGASEKPSANIMVTVSVGGDGHVTSATATGDDSQVASCVANHVRGWKFDGGGQTQIPFHFVRQ